MKLNNRVALGIVLYIFFANVVVLNVANPISGEPITPPVLDGDVKNFDEQLFKIPTKNLNEIDTNTRSVLGIGVLGSLIAGTIIESVKEALKVLLEKSND